MPVLTWRNVQDPNFDGTQRGFQNFSGLLDRASTGLSQGLGQFNEQAKDQVDSQLVARAMQYRDPENYRNALASGALTGGIDPTLTRARTLGMLDDRVSGLIRDAAGQQEVNKGAYAFDRTKTGDALLDTNKEGINAFQTAARSGSQAAMDAVVRAYPGLQTLNPGQLQTVFSNGQSSETSAMSNQDKRFELGNKYETDADNKAGQALFERGFPSIANSTAALDYLNSIGPSLKPSVSSALRTKLEAKFGALSGPGADDPLAAAGTTVPGMSTGTGVSVGERNNNTGNIKDVGQFKGNAGYIGTDDKGFAKFSNPAAGNTAMDAQLGRYINGTAAPANGKPLNTIGSIIPTWAPVGKENTPEQVANYKTYVASRLGIDPDAQITPAQIPALRTAMSEFETGNRASGVIAPTAIAATDLATSAKAAGQPTAADLYNKTTARGRVQAALDTALSQGASGIVPDLKSARGSTKTPAEVAAEIAPSMPGMTAEQVERQINEVQAKIRGAKLDSGWENAAVAGAIIKRNTNPRAALSPMRLITGSRTTNDSGIDAQIDELRTSKVDQAIDAQGVMTGQKAIVDASAGAFNAINTERARVQRLADSQMRTTGRVDPLLQNNLDRLTERTKALDVSSDKVIADVANNSNMNPRFAPDPSVQLLQQARPVPVGPQPIAVSTPAATATTQPVQSKQRKVWKFGEFTDNPGSGPVVASRLTDEERELIESARAQKTAQSMAALGMVR